ncbi:MAG: serine hydrolase domain-containing protein [Nannocystaceae bacterium]
MVALALGLGPREGVAAAAGAAPDAGESAAARTGVAAGRSPGPAAPTLAEGDPRAACLAAHADAPARYRGLVRALCSEAAGLEVVGASLAIVERGSPPRVITWGHTRAGGPPIAAGTGFRIGSLTKILTAALALALVDDGLLGLDAPLSAVLPELAEGVDDRLTEVTLRQLLTHSGGLAELWPGDVVDGETWLRALGERELLAAPGALWSYANVGYAVIGAAIERASGERWAALLERRLLRPLGLAHTSADPEVSLRTGAALGHLGRGDGAPALDVAEDFAIGARGAAWTIPAGGVIASSADVATLALALVDPGRSPLSPASIEVLTTATLPTHERPGEGQAAGLRVTPRAGGSALLRASGDTGDFAADLVLAPSEGVAIVVLGNSGDHLRATLAAGLHDLLGVGAPVLSEGPAAALDHYVGDYAIGDLEGVLAVREGGDGLTIAAPILGPAPIALEPLGDHRFRAGALGPLTFVLLGEGGAAEFLRSRAWVAARLE